MPKNTFPNVVREIGPRHSHEDSHAFTDLWLLEIPVFGLQYCLHCNTEKQLTIIKSCTWCFCRFRCGLEMLVGSLPSSIMNCKNARCMKGKQLLLQKCVLVMKKLVGIRSFSFLVLCITLALCYPRCFCVHN